MDEAATRYSIGTVTHDGMISWERHTDSRLVAWWYEQVIGWREIFTGRFRLSCLGERTIVRGVSMKWPVS